MKAPHILLVLLFSVLCSVKLNAEQSPYIFRHIGVTDGLPDNYVKSVFEIPDGRLGVRTTAVSYTHLDVYKRQALFLWVNI